MPWVRLTLSGKDKNNRVFNLSTGLGGARVVKYENEYDLINAEPGIRLLKSDSIVDGAVLQGHLNLFAQDRSLRKGMV